MREFGVREYASVEPGSLGFVLYTTNGYMLAVCVSGESFACGGGRCSATDGGPRCVHYLRIGTVGHMSTADV